MKPSCDVDDQQDTLGEPISHIICLKSRPSLILPLIRWHRFWNDFSSTPHSFAVVESLKPSLQPVQCVVNAAVIPTLAECLANFRDLAESLGRKRLDEMTEKNRSKSVKPSVTARQIADIINNKIMVLVAANAITDPDRYQAELDALKGIIGQYNAIARSRRPQKATK